MLLDEQDLRNGLKFIVGKWQVDFIVNAFSDDLAHIPATEFKSDDGRDFSAITFTFFEDHSVVMEDTSTGREVKGEWEQTGWGEYHYTLNDFIDIPDGAFKDNVEKLSVQEENLVFSLGFLAIAMKKIEDGVVTETKKPDIGDLVPSAEDEAMKDIVGCYEVAKAMSMVGDDFGMYSREEVTADVDKKLAAGEIEADDVSMYLQAFNTVIEFTEDHRAIGWMKIPDNVSEDALKEALESGEILGVKDGMFAAQENEWKAVNSKYYYNSGEHRELFGEVQSPWDELTFDEEGLMDFGGGMMKLRRI